MGVDGGEDGRGQGAGGQARPVESLRTKRAFSSHNVRSYIVYFSYYVLFENEKVSKL